MSYSTFEQFIDAASRAWSTKHPARYIPPNPAPSSFGDQIKTLVAYDNAGTALIRNSAERVPWVICPNMPAERVPYYAAFLYQCAVAAVAADDPVLSSEITATGPHRIMLPIVGTRLGMMLAVGPPSDKAVSQFSSMLYWDPKRAAMWQKRATHRVPFAHWYEGTRMVQSVPSEHLEVLMAWIRVAPLVACMASTAEFALGSGYSVPFVERSISEYMKQTLSRRAYTQAALSLPLTWDLARMAAIGGYPNTAVHAWANDAMLATSAERRILTEPAALEASRARSQKMQNKYGRALSSIGVSHDNWMCNDTWRAVAQAQEYVIGDNDDAMSVATALMEETVEGCLGPSDSVTAMQTQVPTRAPTPPAPMSAREEQAIRDAVRHVHESALPPTSIAMGLNDNMSVRW